jgi:hypothetical protein
MAVRQLRNQADITKTLAWIWRQVESDTMPILKGKALTYILATLSATITEHDQEARIVALEMLRDGGNQ